MCLLEAVCDDLFSVLSFPLAAVPQYSLELRQVRIRVVAIRQSALFAWRLPPSVETMPDGSDDAWTGLAPHSAATWTVRFHPSGELSPAAY